MLKMDTPRSETSALVSEGAKVNIDKATTSIALALGTTSTWMETASSSFSEINWYQIAGRIACICFFASLASLLPVVCPFSDPYDLSQAGILWNGGYFLWYSGIGWGFLWMVNAMWAARLLNVELHICGVVVVPTLFAVALFTSTYIILGGPAPLGTLSLGSICFLVEWVCLWKFMLRGHQCGHRLLAAYVVWVLLLVLYFILTLLMKRIPYAHSGLAAFFPFLAELILELDFVELILGEQASNCHPDQLHTAALFKLMFVALHSTYQNFLFPVLGSVKSVLTSAVIGFALSTGQLLEQTVSLDARHGRGNAAAEAYAKKNVNRVYVALSRCTSPISFGCLLAFDLYGFNQGMFYTFDILSADQLFTCQIGIAINFAVALASLLLSGYMCHRWLALNPGGGTDLLGEDGVNVDLSRFTVIRSLEIVKELTIGRLSDFFTLLWMTFAAVTTVVGVCMVMKHDGMDIDGWAKFLFDGGRIPYPLCPLWATWCQRAAD